MKRRTFLARKRAVKRSGQKKPTGKSRYARKKKFLVDADHPYIPNQVPESKPWR